MDRAAAPSPFPWRRELRNGLALALVPVAIVLAFMAGSTDFTLTRDDSICAFQPLLSDSLRQLFAGHWPLWSHHSSCGYPLLARPIDILYPPHLVSHVICLACALPDREIVVSYLLHLYAGGVFAFLYLRYLGAAWAPASIGVLGFTLSGLNLGFWTNWPNYFFVTAYIPLGFLIIERLRAGAADRFWTWLTTLVCALVMLVNSPMVIIKYFLLVGFYLLLRTDRASLRRSLGALLPAFFLAVVIASGQILATSQLVRMSERVADDNLGLVAVFLVSLRPLGYAALVWPFLQWPWGIAFYPNMPFTGGGIFVGPLPLLGLLGLFASRRPWPGPVRALLALMIPYGILAVGMHLVANHYLVQLPVLKMFRWPMRWLFELGALLPLFTGLALEELRRSLPNRGSKLAGAFFLGVAVILALGLNDIPAGFENWLAPARVLWIAGAAVLFGLLVWQRHNGFFGAALAFTVVALIVNVPLAQQNTFATADISHFTRDPLYLDTVGQERVLYLANREEEQQAGGEQSYACVMPHQFQTRSVLSYRYTRPLAEWAAGTNAMGYIDDEPLAIRTFLEGHLLETLRVGHVLVPRTNRALREACDRHPNLTLDRELNWVAVYRHTGFRAPAFFVAEVRDENELPGPQDLGRVKLSQVCYAESGYGGPRRFQGSGTVADFDEQQGHISLTTDSPSDGFLVVTTTGYDGWQARIDGEPAPLVRVNSSFMGLQMPAGRHHVELLFWPGTIVWLLRSGALLGAVAAVVFAAGLVRRLRRPEPVVEEGAEEAKKEPVGVE
jgi:hypothetical protein